MKKILLAFLLGLFAGNSFSQTAIIAHKSHSGTSEDFAYADPANYGGPALSFEKVIRINDTVAQAETNGFYSRKLLIINNRELQDSLKDSTTVLRLEEYELDILLGKDTNSKVVPLSEGQTPEQYLKSVQQHKVEPDQNIKPAKPKKQHKSMLYFGLLLGVSVLFGWMRKRHVRA